MLTKVRATIDVQHLHQGTGADKPTPATRSSPECGEKSVPQYFIKWRWTATERGSGRSFIELANADIDTQQRNLIPGPSFV